MATVKIVRPPVCGDVASEIPLSQWPLLLAERRNFCKSVIPRDCRMLLFFIDDGEKTEWLGHGSRDAYLRGLDLDPEMVEVALRGLQISDPEKAQPFEKMVELGKRGRPKKGMEKGVDNTFNKRSGTGRDHILLRLDRGGFTELAAAVRAKEISARSAAQKAGIPYPKRRCPECGHTW